MAIEELSKKQARLAALNQIIEAYRAAKKSDIYLEPISFTDTHGRVPIASGHNALRQHQSLSDLAADKLIEILDYQNLLGIHISIKDLPALEEVQRALSDSIPARGNMPRIIYSPRTGKGKIDGSEFRFNRNSDNRKLFKILATSPGHRISRSDAWKITNHRTPLNDAAGISDFSRLVSKLRAGLHDVSPSALILTKKYVELRADIKLTD